MSAVHLKPLERAITEATILDLYGCPGEDWETAAGDTLVLELLRARGLRALSDEALLDLARLHEGAETSGRFRADTHAAGPIRPIAAPSRRIPVEGHP